MSSQETMELLFLMFSFLFLFLSKENEDSTTLPPLEDFVKLMEGEGEEKMKELREIFKSAKCHRCEINGGCQTPFSTTAINFILQFPPF